MRLKLLKAVFAFACLYFISNIASAQGIFTGINHMVINRPCTDVCANLNFQVPHLKSDDDYQIVSIPYTPYPYTTTTGNELTALYADDLYSQAITLPFPICFYGEVHTQVVVGSNGLLTFDIANQNCDNAYTVIPEIPRLGGTICQQEGIYYPRSSIMGAYSDLDPRASASPSGRKIEWRMEGTAPFRRFIASWYRVGVFGNNACGTSTPTTFQIVVNESTSVIEVFFEQKICVDNSEGNAILGVQDGTRTKAVAAPGKNARIWSANREGYRFIPSGSTSRFVKSEIYDLGGAAPIATATTATTAPALVDISFANICLTAASQQYVVKTFYSSCIDPTQNIIIEDTITINRDPELGATATTTNTLCGPPSGTVNVTVPAGKGSAPFTFTLDPGPGQVVQTGNSPMNFANVGQGAHTVTVVDASGNCTSTINGINVARTNNLAANVSSVATACPTASNGSITVTPTTGAGPYTFVLDGTTTQTGATTTTFNNVGAGPHTVVVTDASGCTTAGLPVDVTAGPALTTTVNKTDVRCNGGTTGTITVTQPTVGSAPYEYSLDGTTWQSSNTFTGLAANTYMVYYREGAGCQNSQPVTITQPPVLTGTANAVAVVCNGEDNGTITVTAGGGVTPYEYSIDGGTNWQSSNIFKVPQGPYTVIVRDANGCTVSSGTTVTEPAVLSANAVGTNATCDGGDDGTITVAATGGNGAYQYSLNGVDFQSSNIFNVGPGDHTVTVKDNLGCITTVDITVDLTNNFTFTPMTNPTICEGSSAQLELISNATDYTWTPATGLSDPKIHNPVANPTTTTTYTVKAVLGRCIKDDITVTVNVSAAPVPDAGAPGFICYGQTYQLHAANGVKYQWTPSTYLDDPSKPDPISKPAKTITYTLSILEDVNGCPSLVTDQVTVDVTPPIKITTFPYDTIGYPGDKFTLKAVAAVPSANIFSWSPTTGLSDPTSPTPVLTVGAIGTDQTYRVTATTAAGCVGEGFVHLRVYKGPEIYVPTAFTPNGDGKNERFYPFPVGIRSINYFRVYNRAGQLMFSSNTLMHGWDGTLKGQAQPGGTYVWMAQAVTGTGQVLTKQGTITLIR